MIVRLALRTLLMHPIRTAVLAGGFGLGVAVMANLLGVAEVVLEQSQSPALLGGGDVVVTGAASRLTSGRYLLWGGLGAPAFADRITAASPTRRGSVFLVQDGTLTRLRARGGIPSLERALEDPETAGVSAWVDAPGDAEWTVPDPADVLRSLDRFHAIPDVPARAGSWVEWLYFNGQAGSTRFPGTGAARTAYLAILASHTVLAAAVPVLALVTLSRALAGRFDRHRRIARWTLPIWLYVSVTGVVVYWMLYRTSWG